MLNLGIMLKQSICLKETQSFDFVSIKAGNILGKMHWSKKKIYFKNGESNFGLHSYEWVNPLC